MDNSANAVGSAPSASTSVGSATTREPRMRPNSSPKSVLGQHQPPAVAPGGVGRRQRTGGPGRLVQPVGRDGVAGQRTAITCGAESVGVRPHCWGSRRRRDHVAGVDPVTSVTPGSGRQGWVWFRRVIGSRRADRVGGVQVGVERDGVVGIALQRPEAVVVHAAESVGDGLGEHGVWADLDEGRVLCTRGRDGVAEPHRVAHVGHPVVGIEQRWRIGIFDVGGDDRNARSPRRQIGQCRPQLRQDRIHHRVVRRDLHVHPAGEACSAEPQAR